MLEKLWSAFIEYGFQSKYFLIIFIVCIIPIIAKWLGADELVSAIKDLIFGFACLTLLVAGVFLFLVVVDIFRSIVDVIDNTGTFSVVIAKIILLAFCIFLFLIFKHIIKKESLFFLVVYGFVIYSLYNFKSESLYEIIVYISPVLLYLICKYIIKPVLIFVSDCYKIRTLKSMESIIKKYIKENGYQSIWRFDSFICTRYKRKVNLQYKWKIIEKYFPYEDIFDSKEYFKEYSFRYLISKNYGLIAIRNYMLAIREYVYKFQTFEESDLIKLIPEFQNFTLNEDGSRDMEFQHKIIHNVLNLCVNKGILKVSKGKNGNVYMPVHRKSDNVRDCGEIEID